MNMMAIPTPANCRLVVACLTLLLTASAGLRLAVAEPAADVATFLRERGIDQQ